VKFPTPFGVKLSAMTCPAFASWIASLALIAGCSPPPPADGAPGASGAGASDAGSSLQEPAPPRRDPFEGWSEERKAAWERERQERVGRIFKRAVPTLEKAGEAYDRHEDLPESHLWKEDRESNQERIDRLLDEAIEALELAGLEDVRRELRSIEQRSDEIDLLRARDREARLSAPRDEELNALEDAYTTSWEEYGERIEAAEAELTELERRSEELRTRFVEELRAIGVDIDESTAESLLASVSGDDFVQLCVVFDNVRLLTEQLRLLTEQSGESLEVAKRYYGLYVVLIRVMDRLQRDFVETIRESRIPRLRELAEEARENIADAQRNLRTGGDPEIGRRNIEANQLTIDATAVYSEYLEAQAADVERQNRELQPRMRDALNTYDTVRVSSQVAKILRDSARDLGALLELEVPRLRGFENRELKDEFSRLTERLVDLQ
jgi:hypothetical protein